MEKKDFLTELNNKAPEENYRRIDEKTALRDMRYATNLFKAGEGTLEESLRVNLSKQMMHVFYAFVAGNGSFEGIDKPTITDLQMSLDLQYDIEMMKKDKSYPISAHRTLFSHIDEPKHTEEESIHDMLYGFVASLTVKQLLKKNMDFKRRYQTWLETHYPMLCEKKNPSLNIEDVISSINDPTSTSNILYKTELSESMQEMLEAKSLSDFYEEETSLRSTISTEFNTLLKQSAEIYYKRNKKAYVQRVINIIRILSEAGYMDDMIAENNTRALKLKLYPMLLGISQGFDFENLLPSELKSKNEVKEGELSESTKVLLNADWKNKTPKEQALATLEKVSFPVDYLIDERYYADFSMLELATYSAYYTNRLEKILGGIYRGAFLHDKLGTLYDSIENEAISRSDQQRIGTVLRQLDFVLDLSYDKFSWFYDKTGIQYSEKERPGLSEEIKEARVGSLPKEFESFREGYQKYYDFRLNRENNNLDEDYEYAFYMRNMSQGLYVLKDNSLEILIKALSLQDRTKINFGLVKEERKKKNEYGEDQVLFGIDLEGMPPIFLHYKKEEFDRVAKKYFGNREFPYYQGVDDMQVGNTQMTTPLAYRFTKGAKQLLALMQKSIDPRSPAYAYIEHLIRNIHPNKNLKNQKEMKSKSKKDRD